MRQVGEPSVEEILESIKKVIARDNRAEAAQVRARREAASAPATGPAIARGGADVLDLTEVAAQIMGAERFMPAEPAEPEAAVDLHEDDFDDEPHADEGDETAMSINESPLLPESTTASMRDSLAALAMLSQPGAQPQIVRSGETSLEGLVRDMLRPMLAEWLDKNLPPMVEKMVAGEIARIVGKKG
jgi:cell pole-organizing protein PopZ